MLERARGVGPVRQRRQRALVLAHLAVASRVEPAPRRSELERQQDFARQVWSQFDILISKPMAVGPLVWGSFTWGQMYTWGTTMSLSDVRLLRRLIRDHKSAHDTCTYFHFNFANGALWATFSWGDGTLWGGVGDVVTLVCGEKQWEVLSYM